MKDEQFVEGKTPTEGQPDNARPLMRHNICAVEPNCRLPEKHTGNCSDAECPCGLGWAYHTCPKNVDELLKKSFAHRDEAWRDGIKEMTIESSDPRIKRDMELVRSEVLALFTDKETKV